MRVLRFGLVLALVSACSNSQSVVGGPAPVDAAIDAMDASAAMDIVADDLVAPDVVDAPPPMDLVDVAPDLGPEDAQMPGMCRGDDDCAGSADGPVCALDTRRCVGCTAERNACSAGQYCDTTQRRCLSGCQDDDACGTTSDGDAGAPSEGGVTTRPLRCDPGTRACVECVVDAHCPAGTLCVGNLCVAGCNSMRACPTGQTCCNGGCVDPQANTAHCGACGQSCSVPNASPACANGTCAVGMCTAPYADCDSDGMNGCETDTSSALAHCGGCGRSCEARPHTAARCDGGRCAYTCEQGFADCDGVESNGCEVDLRASTEHCGACGVRCDPANATARCDMGRCAVGSCDADYGDCDGNATNGCEADLRSSTSHCGGCGAACASTPNTLVVCAARACQRVCTTGFADCDGVESNGCEVDTRTSNSHCGGCGRACMPSGGAGMCVAGSCTLTACATGRADCDGLPGNGCEVDVTSSTDHCGGCNARCASRNNAQTRCAAGSCAYTCDASFGDCDGNLSNGCETDTRTSVAHCGACGRACAARPNSVASCAAGACAYTCAAGFADCDGNPSNGCEVDTRTSAANCGACRRACSVSNGTAACVASACVVASCATGFANCDNNAANGCESTLAQDRANCGRCGNACPGGQSCYAGLCSVTCGNSAPVPSPVAGCTNVAPLGVATAQSAWSGQVATRANDGNRCTGWNAGTYPQRWWQVDLREVMPIRGITLIPDQSPSPANVVHVVSVSSNGSSFTNVRTISQVMSNGGTYSFDFGQNVSARYVRVTTTSSPSWVAWSEVGVFRCF
ncbi:MAG: discoidin domain-containing protein [Polyangiales bacterium]